MFRQPVQKPSSESSGSVSQSKKVENSKCETSVNNNSPSQDSNHPDDLFQLRYVTPGFKPFSYKITIVSFVIVSLC